jgi:glycosyltransferase involved in cell wall biosynthesis
VLGACRRIVSMRFTPAPICSCWPRASRATAWPIAEALAHGLPVDRHHRRRHPDTVPPDAGVLVEPNDVKALTRALRMLIENPKERQWLAAGARDAAETLPTWQDSAKLFAGAIEALA